VLLLWKEEEREQHRIRILQVQSEQLETLGRLIQSTPDDERTTHESWNAESNENETKIASAMECRNDSVLWRKCIEKVSHSCRGNETEKPLDQTRDLDERFLLHLEEL